MCTWERHSFVSCYCMLVMLLLFQYFQISSSCACKIWQKIKTCGYAPCAIWMVDLIVFMKFYSKFQAKRRNFNEEIITNPKKVAWFAKKYSFLCYHVFIMCYFKHLCFVHDHYLALKLELQHCYLQVIKKIAWAHGNFSFISHYSLR